MISYKTIESFKPGIIERLLRESYFDLIDYFPTNKIRLFQQWKKEDENAFDNPDTIGKHILFSCLGDIVIGYFSWDDRQYPTGYIGQNFILPKYQGQGFGKAQIEMIKKTFIDNEFETIIATTGNHEFFKPAQKMYQDCGFVIHNKKKGDLFELIEYIEYLKY